MPALSFVLPHIQPWHGLALLHIAAVATGLLSYIVLTHSGRQQRPPTAAIAWVIALVAFPYLALPVFLLFGTRKLAHVAQVHAASANADLHLAITRGLDLPPPRPCASIRLQVDGEAALHELLALLGQARRKIEIEIFLFRDDPVGERVAAALSDAARRGVEVRVLLDGLGTFIGRRQSLHLLRNAGAQVRWFSPLRLRLRPRFGRGNLRNHRKLVLVDDHTLWSGGRNLAEEYFLGTDKSPAWQDLGFIIEGGIVTDAAACFARDWAMAGGGHSSPAAAPAHAIGPLAQLLPSGPDHRGDTAHALYLQAIHRADARVWAATPYFVPDDALQQALLLAAQRGVEVCLLLPARSNHRMADIARERSLRELVAAGARIHQSPAMLHAKLLLVDDAFASCGSINLDGRSLFLNYELNTLFFDSAQIDALADWFTAQCARSSRHDPRPPGWWRDIGEGLVRAVGFQL